MQVGAAHVPAQRDQLVRGVLGDKVVGNEVGDQEFERELLVGQLLGLDRTSGWRARRRSRLARVRCWGCWCWRICRHVF